MLVVLAFTAEVEFPIEEDLVDTLLRGLDNERNAFSFHTHYITVFGFYCQALFSKFLSNVILYQPLLHLRNSITVALVTEPDWTIAPTKVSSKLTQPAAMISIGRIEFYDRTICCLQN
jgi:hypothetical protein